MSTPQAEAAAPVAGKKNKKPAAPSEVAQAIALRNAEQANRADLFDAQSSLGRARRIQKAAKRDPAVAEIVDQNIALEAITVELRKKLAEVEAERDTAVADLAAAKDEATKARADLAAVLNAPKPQ